ncbi:MAG: tetratricopeptide repeat protein [Acidobacteriota bacterium]
MRRSLRISTAAAFAVVAALIPPLAAQGPADTLARARLAYEKRAEPASAKAAFDLFSQAAQEDPQSYEARWEGARACYFYGSYTRASASDDEKMAIFQSGIDLARQAVTLQPKAAEGHFWLGVLDGVYGEAKGIFKSLSLVPEIKKEMQAALEIDPAIEGWGPDRVLGRLYHRLPWFKGGSEKKSVEYLEKSLKGAPTNALTRLYLAESYKSEGMRPEAIQMLKSIIAMTPDPRWAPEHPTIKADAEKLLKKLE